MTYLQRNRKEGSIIFRIEPVSTLQDARIIDELVQEIWPEIYIPVIGEEQVNYMLKTYQSLENIQQDIAKGDAYFVLYEGQIPIGYTAYRELPGVLYLSKLYLHKETRGKGYASQVFNWLEELGTGKTLRLNVNKYNQGGIAVYEHRGFQCVEACQIDIGEGYVMDDYVYEKDLS
ncbi:GNAT family N-acetyltransferase [Enterococcus sp. LJL98]